MPLNQDGGAGVGGGLPDGDALAGWQHLARPGWVQSAGTHITRKPGCDTFGSVTLEWPHPDAAVRSPART